MNRLQRSFLSAIVAVCAAIPAQAVIPTGYYSSLNGKKEGALKTAVYELVHNFTRVSSYSNLPKYFQQTDLYPNSNRWWDMYSDIPLYAPSFSGLNREHSFPKSWWGGSDKVGAYVDLNHLYPSEMAANTAKSNYPLGEVNRSNTVKFDNSVCSVGYPIGGQGGGASYVFEPNDEYKGDFARTYFYMATCYQDLTWKYTFMVAQNTYPTLTPWAVNLLLKWHREDPVSQKELDRNEAVYRIQNNRNPFIDYPNLAEFIWGDRRGDVFNTSESSTPPGSPNLITPVQNMDLDFGQVALGRSTTAKLFFRGENLYGSLDLVLSRGDKAMFSLPVNSISASLVNSEDGYWLTITYRPTELGEHSTKIIVSEGGIVGSRGITLRGECLPVPTLGTCTATEPTDITSTSYVANWTAPANDDIDYFVVTRTRYTNGTAVVEQLVAEENFLEITDFNTSDRESYSVQSSRLGYLSEASNVVFVDHAGVSGVDAGMPLVVQGFEGFLRFVCSAPQTSCRIYDVSGKLVNAIETIDNNLDVPMLPGIYFVTTAEHTAPVKVAVR